MKYVILGNPIPLKTMYFLNNCLLWLFLNVTVVKFVTSGAIN